MKVGQIGPTLLVPEKTVNFFWVKPVVPSFILKMRKSHKKSACVYAYTHACTQIRDGGGQIWPPPSQIGLRLDKILPRLFSYQGDVGNDGSYQDEENHICVSIL